VTIVEVACDYCKKIFPRELRRINEAKKFGWKQYCSGNCHSLAKRAMVSLQCGNPNCNKIFFRSLHEISISKICFCSRSCAAVVNNQRSRKRKPKLKICPNCGSYFSGRRKYCSSICLPKTTIIPKEQIIQEIKKFYKGRGRIPFKREYFHWKAARFRFGTWNKAVLAAGFEPNPVKFAKKFTAKDGHRCDSLSEKIIDDWLFSKKIFHLKNAKYLNTLFTADFKVNDIFIEFFGLTGALKTYDKLMMKKLKIIKKNDLRLIKIFPKDLFPESKLNDILNELIKPEKTINKPSLNLFLHKS